MKLQVSAANACEVGWCAYAWPVSPQMAGRVFFVSQEGDVLARENGTPGETIYAGADAPSPDAAFDASSMPGSINGRLALQARLAGRVLANSSGGKGEGSILGGLGRILDGDGA